VDGGAFTSYPFGGLIDDVRIYNYARTPAQVAYDFNRGKPIAEWKFDECKGGTIYDSAKSWNGGTANNGILHLGTTGVTATGTCASSSDSFWYNGRNGKVNSAGSFDGLGDYILIPQNNALEGFSQMSVSAWIYSKGSQYSGIVTDFESWDGGWLIAEDDLTIKFDINNGVTEKIAAWNGVQVNHWHHVLGTYDGSDIRLYIDGSLKDAIAQTGTTKDADNNLSIGRDFNNNYFDGLIDDVKIWNYALTAEQVKTEYAGGAVKFGQ
jgi:hypothetical protein